MKLVYDHFQPPEGTENGSLAPIIFLHGGCNTRKTWRKFADAIVKETWRQVYAYDMRNHGDSPWSDVMDLDVLVSDLEEFMNHHNIHRAILIGHSLGGKTALAFALKKPEAVEKLIVEDTSMKKCDPITQESLVEIFTELQESIKSVPPYSSEVEAKEAIVSFLERNLLPVQPDGTLRGIYDIDAVPIKREGEKFVWQVDMDVIKDMIASDKTNKVWSGFYTGEVLFIYGTRSFVKVNEDTELYRYFPRATLLPVEGVGHLVHQVCPERFLKLIIDFILKREECYF